MPMTPFIGVRISWLMLARNSLFASAAASARLRASSSESWSCFSFVMSVVDPTSRSAKLRAQIPNPDGRLRPGQFAQLQLDTGGPGGEGVLVPEESLLLDGNVRYVFTVVDGKAHRVEIKTGLRVPGKVQALEGLKAGDVVITSGQTKPIMHEGLGVQVLPSQGAPQPGAPKGQQKPPAQAAAKPAQPQKPQDATK